jgi:hypothetical protein
MIFMFDSDNKVQTYSYSYIQKEERKNTTAIDTVPTLFE